MPETDFAAMDEAGKEALKEMEKLPKKSIIDMGTWWKTWYTKAGHKRLARGLIAYMKKNDKPIG